MDLKFILESILFSAQQPLTPKELRDLLVTAAEQDESGTARAFKKTPIENVIAAVEELAREHEAAARTYRLVCVAGAWQFASQPEFAPWLKALVGHRNRPPRLSAPALETLAIIAYRQPITRAEIEQVRGVAVDGVMQTLLERALVETKGRAEVVGRPNTYGTTPAFLEYFGLKDLDDLPAADELRRIPVTKPDSLLTVDPGLATAPPEQLSLNENGGEPAPSAAPEGGVRSDVSSASRVHSTSSTEVADPSTELPPGSRQGGSTPSPMTSASDHLTSAGGNLSTPSGQGGSTPEPLSTGSRKLATGSRKVSPGSRNLSPGEIQVDSGEIQHTGDLSQLPGGNRKRPAPVLATESGSVQVSPGDSELPPTTGTASNAALDAASSDAAATATTSAEPPAKSRLARRKKDAGSDN